MATYICKYIDKSGKEKKRTIEADSQEKAQQIIKSEGNTVISVDVGSLFDKDIQFGFKRSNKVNVRELGVFCRQFVSILKAGVSVVTALNMLAEQTESKNLKAALEQVRDSVEKGDSLGTAMRKTGVFPGILINMVDAGEASGSLEVALDRMATFFDKDAKLRGIIKKALTYPAMLIVIVIAVVIVMMVVVIPTFEGMFAEVGSDLPPMTKALIAVSDFLIQKWYICIAAVVILAVAFILYKKTNTGTHQLANLALKAPVFGNLNTKSASARFARNFSTLIASGMPMMDAIEITAGTMDNILFREELLRLRDQVALGQSISSFLKSSELFPPMLCHMIGIGEETGNLEEMLDGCAVYYEEETELATQTLTQALEPMITVVMALIVGVIVIAIYSPMMSLYNAIE